MKQFFTSILFFLFGISIQAVPLLAQDFFVVICYHDVVDTPNELDDDAITAAKLTSHFQWLKENGYTVVSVQDLIDARDGKKNLPPKSVVLTFDDGYKSFYRNVFPLLKAFNYSAVLAICGIWVDTQGKKGLYRAPNTQPKPDQFMTWAEVKEVSDSGLVEIASHSYDLHHGIPANPQKSLQPASVTLEFDVKTGQYENRDHFKNRIRADLKKNSDTIKHHIGKAPRAIVWPYGRFSMQNQEIAAELGMKINFLLTDDVRNSVHNLAMISRNYYNHDGELSNFIDMLTVWEKERIEPVRSIRIDLDYVYDPDPTQFEKNLSALIERINQYKINTVFLQAFSDNKALGYATELYFPNRHLPVKSDIMNRVTWQLRSRAGVSVFAWMPIIGFDLKREELLVKSQKNDSQQARVDPDRYKRLSPFNPEARRIIQEIYEDLALHVPIEGIAFHDDGVLSDFEDASAAGVQAQIQAGFPASIQAIKSNKEQLQKWTRWKTEYLTNFTKELTRTAQKYRGELKTSRSLFSLPVLNPFSEEWFAQNLDNFIENYSFVALMAMPYMEKAEAPDKWMDTLFQKVKEHPKGLKSTLFELQAVDWNNNNKPIESEKLREQMRTLQANGAIHFGYYPDDFIKGVPDLKIVKEGLSISKDLFIP